VDERHKMHHIPGAVNPGPTGQRDVEAPRAGEVEREQSRTVRE
jgi:hypothetical protein